MLDDPRKILAVIKGVPYESVSDLSSEEAEREIHLRRFGSPIKAEHRHRLSFTTLTTLASSTTLLMATWLSIMLLMVFANTDLYRSSGWAVHDIKFDTVLSGWTFIIASLIDLAIVSFGFVAIAYSIRHNYPWHLAILTISTPFIHLVGAGQEAPYCYPFFFAPPIITLYFTRRYTQRALAR